MSIFINFLLAINVMVSLLIILIVLMQRPKSEGLGAAFGGGMTENLFGAQTTNVLQKTTRVLGGLFFAVTLLLSMLYSRQARHTKESAIQRELANAPAPKTSPDDQSKKNVINLPENSALTPEAIRQLLEQKLKDAANASGTSAASGTGALPAPSPSSKSKDDLEAPPLQLQTVPPGGTGAPTGDLEAPKLQLQTGTAAGADKTKDGGL